MDFIAITHRNCQRTRADAGAVNEDIHAFGQCAAMREDFLLQLRIMPNQVLKALADRAAADLHLSHTVDEGLQRGRNIDFDAHVYSKPIISFMGARKEKDAQPSKENGFKMALYLHRYQEAASR